MGQVPRTARVLSEVRICHVSQRLERVAAGEDMPTSRDQARALDLEFPLQEDARGVWANVEGGADLAGEAGAFVNLGGKRERERERFMFLFWFLVVGEFAGWITHRDLVSSSSETDACS
jgi:hypothetical protein